MKNIPIYAICFSIFAYYCYDVTSDYSELKTISNYFIKSLDELDIEFTLQNCHGETIDNETMRKYLKVSGEAVTSSLVEIDGMEKVFRISSKLKTDEDLFFDWIGPNCMIKYYRIKSGGYKSYFEPSEKTMIIAFNEQFLLEEPYDTECHNYEINGTKVSQIEAIDNCRSKKSQIECVKLNYRPSCHIVTKDQRYQIIPQLLWFKVGEDTRMIIKNSMSLRVVFESSMPLLVYIFLIFSLSNTASGFCVEDVVELLSKVTKYLISISKNFPDLEIVPKLFVVLLMLAHHYLILECYFQYAHSSSTYVGRSRDEPAPKITICVDELDFIVTNIHQIFFVRLGFDKAEQLVKFKYNNYTCYEYSLKDCKLSDIPYLFMIYRNLSYFDYIDGGIFVNDGRLKFLPKNFTESGYVGSMRDPKTITVTAAYYELLPPPYETGCNLNSEEDFSYISNDRNMTMMTPITLLLCSSSSWRFQRNSKSDYKINVATPAYITHLSMSPQQTIFTVISQLLSATAFLIGVNVIYDNVSTFKSILRDRYVLSLFYGILFLVHCSQLIVEYLNYETVVKNVNYIQDFDIPETTVAAYARGREDLISPYEFYLSEYSKITANITIHVLSNNFCFLEYENNFPSNPGWTVDGGLISLTNIYDQPCHKNVKYVDANSVTPLLKIKVIPNPRIWSVLFGKITDGESGYIRLRNMDIFIKVSKLTLLPSPYSSNCQKYKPTYIECYETQRQKLGLPPVNLFSPLSIWSKEKYAEYNSTQQDVMINCVDKFNKGPPRCVSYTYNPKSQETNTGDNMQIFFKSMIDCRFIPKLNFQTFLITIFGVIDFWFSVNLLDSLIFTRNYLETKYKRFKKRRRIDIKIVRPRGAKYPRTRSNGRKVAEHEIDEIPEVGTYYVN